MRRAIATGATLLLMSCGGTGARSAHRAATPAGRPLPVGADGRLDPNHIDLSGVAGVTPTEQAAAERLLRGTIISLARWHDVTQAKKDGFTSIGDGFTGTEHYVHWDWIEDKGVLDPTHPESLVYRLGSNGQRTLEAAMYIFPKRYRFANAPDVGGALVQFHSHFNECYSGFPAPRFITVTRSDGTCPPGLEDRLTNLMVHVWVRPNPCGPFAPIGGFASGAIAPGETQLCDRVHGSPAD